MCKIISKEYTLICFSHFWQLLGNYKFSQRLNLASTICDVYSAGTHHSLYDISLGAQCGIPVSLNLGFNYPALIGVPLVLAGAICLWVFHKKYE